MQKCVTALLAPVSLAFLISCGQGDSIDDSGAVYDGVPAETAITLTGTEPFWGLAIAGESDGGHVARFTHPDDIEGSEFVATRFAGNNGLGFSGELDGKRVQVAITPGECSDGMSERSYPFAATVALGDATLFGCGFTATAPFAGPKAP